ncbi:sensor histidine kinase [Neomicrococcus lactis]
MSATTTPSLNEVFDKRRWPIVRFLRRHPVITDLLVCAAYVVLTGFSLVFVSEISTPLWVLAALVLIIAVLVYFRRRWPLVVFVVVLALEMIMMFVDVTLSVSGMGTMIMLYTVATQYRPRRSFVLATLATALIVAGLWVHIDAFIGEQQPGEEISPIFLMILVGFTVLMSNYFVTALGSWVRNNRIHEAEIANWGAKIQELAQSQERTRIAREMHDVVAHSLSVMIALSDGARIALKRSPDKAGEVLEDIGGTGRAALADMRRMLSVLREDSASPLAPQPSQESLRDMLEGFRKAGMPLTFTQSGPALRSDPTLELTIFRVLQESLTNSLRYAPSASDVQVRMDRTDTTVTLTVYDDGAHPGADRSVREGSAPVTRTRTGQGSGQGLKGIAERAAMYDGTLEAGPTPDGGWKVLVTLNIPAHSVPTEPSTPTNSEPRVPHLRHHRTKQEDNS